MSERFAISNLEILKLDPEDFKITQMKDWYLMRLIRFANELGMKGKKIKEIYRIDEGFANHQGWLTRNYFGVIFVLRSETRKNSMNSFRSCR